MPSPTSRTSSPSNNIDCGWTKSGYFLGAWCQSHYEAMAKKVDMLNTEAQSGAFMVPRTPARAEIGSDYYRGGMVVGRAAHIHPALYYKGLLGSRAEGGVPSPRAPRSTA
jgi:glycine/D-amino acid oxidase-like deaminating enzyme